MPASFCPHVLVVDDDPGIHEALTAALADRYVVHTAASGAEACACLRAHPIAAVILDAILGEEHGLDLVERFRALSLARILVLTAYSSEELAIRAVWAGVDGYLKKPISVSDVHAALKRAIPHQDWPADLAARAQQYLDEHVSKPFRAGGLARQLGISDAHLRWLFGTVYGKTPHRYLEEVRMQKAATLLRTTGRGIEQIAFEVGYPNVGWFNKRFKRSYGMTPSAFRASQRHPRPPEGREGDPPGG